MPRKSMLLPCSTASARSPAWTLLLGLCLASPFPLQHLDASDAHRQTVVVVQGAEGEPQFGRMFAEWTDRWEAAAQKAEADFVRIGRESSEKLDRELLQQAVESASRGSDDTFWLVLIGHGTFDGRAAKFNLRGPDVSAAELAEWLKPLQRPQVVIDCSSSSSPFLNALSGPNRIVVTATRSGNERNFARFGDYISSAITDPQADLDKDGETSVLEAYLQAAHQVAAFYSDQARLATEHSLLDDNGDGLGTPADWFRGTRAVKTAKDGATPDGIRANQVSLIRSELERQLSPELRRRRDELEFRLAALRSTKATTDEAEYYQRLEEILRELAELYAELPGGDAPATASSPAAPAAASSEPAGTSPSPAKAFPGKSAQPEVKPAEPSSGQAAPAEASPADKDSAARSKDSARPERAR